MAELIMRKVLDRLGVVLLLKVCVIVVSAQQSGAVQFINSCTPVHFHLFQNMLQLLIILKN